MHTMIDLPSAPTQSQPATIGGIIADGLPIRYSGSGNSPVADSARRYINTVNTYIISSFEAHPVCACEIRAQITTSTKITPALVAVTKILPVATMLVASTVRCFNAIWLDYTASL